MASDLMARMQGERNLKLFCPLTPPPGWKCPKRFRLGVGRGWEGSSDSDDEELDELLLMASQQYEKQAQTQESASFDVVPQRNGQFFSDNKEEESDELLLIASQEYEQQAAIEHEEEQRYGSPKSTEKVDQLRKEGVPLKT